MSASEELRAVRRACGLGQEQWAAFVGVGRKTVQRWEAGTAVPDARAEAAILELCAERGVGGLHALPRVLAEARMAHHAAPERRSARAGPAPLGRGRDLAAVREALDVSRLVTLVGPAGVGKTTLGLAVAEAVDPGAVVVLLAPIGEAGMVLATVASAMSLRQTRDRSLRDMVVAGLQGASLLVLDSCEHLSGLGEIVDDLLRSCPSLRVLATSRSAMHQLGEHAYPVEPLSTEAAVELFERAARSTAPGFSVSDANRGVVGALCERLDRLPLALELMGPRVRVASPELLLEHVDRQIELLRSKAAVADPRHISLEAAVAWSYGLLDEAEQHLFRSLGVFAGPFSASAAAAVADHDPVATMAGLDALLDLNLLRRVDDQPRLSMLQTVRAFALEQLGRVHSIDAVAATHASYHLERAKAEGEELHGPAQLAALAMLRESYDDMRAALVWLLAHDRAAAVDLAVSLAPYWDTVSAFSEGRGWLSRAIEVGGDDASVPWFALASASTWSSYFAAMQGDMAATDRLASAALEVWERYGLDAGRGYALLMLGFAAVERDDLDAGERLLTESASALERGGDRWGRARPLNNLGELARMRGDLERAEHLHAQALAIVRDVGDLGSQPNMLCGLGHVHLARGDAKATRALALEAIAISERLGNRLGTAASIELLGLAHLAESPRVAARWLGAAAALRRRLGAPIEARDRALVEDARRQLEHTEEWQHGASASIDDIAREATEFQEVSGMRPAQK